MRYIENIAHTNEYPPVMFAFPNTPDALPGNAPVDFMQMFAKY